MRLGCTLVAAVALCGALLLEVPADAASPRSRDPDWPCQQIKVPELSLAAVWSGPPIDPRQMDWQQDQAAADLVHLIAQRRVPLAQAQDAIHAFGRQANEQKEQRLLTLMAGLFSILDQERSVVIAGLDRFGARQKELATGIREDNEKLRQMQAEPTTDTGAINQMVQRVAWEAEVFQDRRQALSYACDVPGKIEQRLFALARTIQQDLQ